MEDDYVYERAKKIISLEGKTVEEGVEQAVNEIEGSDYLKSIYAIYDITKRDYIAFIKNKIKGEEK